MSQSDIIAPILSYEDINKLAEDFLREHNRNEILPVDIEAIAAVMRMVNSVRSVETPT